MFFPSMIRSVGGCAPARCAKVGSRSMVAAISLQVFPGGTCPGHHIIQDSRMPPSKVVPLCPRSGAFEPPYRSLAPLSEVKMTKVFLSRWRSLRVLRIWPV